LRCTKIGLLSRREKLKLGHLIFTGILVDVKLALEILQTLLSLRIRARGGR